MRISLHRCVAENDRAVRTVRIVLYVGIRDEKTPPPDRAAAGLAIATTDSFDEHNRHRSDRSVAVEEKLKCSQ